MPCFTLKHVGFIVLAVLATLLIGMGAAVAQVKNPELEALKKEIEELRDRKSVV